MCKIGNKRRSESTEIVFGWDSAPVAWAYEAHWINSLTPNFQPFDAFGASFRTPCTKSWRYQWSVVQCWRRLKSSNLRSMIWITLVYLWAWSESIIFQWHTIGFLTSLFFDNCVYDKYKLWQNHTSFIRLLIKLISIAWLLQMPTIGLF